MVALNVFSYRFQSVSLCEFYHEDRVYVQSPSVLINYPCLGVNHTAIICNENQIITTLQSSTSYYE